MIDENTWYWVRDQSLAIAARNAGFDLAVYNDYSAIVQDELRKRAIKTAIDEIRMAFDAQTEAELSEITQGVYVISLAAPLTLQYKNKTSDVIYIGMGNIISRIESHFNNSLFDFMQSLSGAEFDFRFAKPKLPYHTDYYKHVEYLMLDYFERSAGSLPILNSNAGNNRNIKNDDDWWVRPLWGNGRRPRWTLTALPDSGFRSLD
jgi:hypothetical protein